MATKRSIKVSPFSLVKKGIITEELIDDPVIVAVCNDNRVRLSEREAFIILYKNCLRK